MKTKSFTLIELLVVIVIIGILAAVIIVSTSSSISKASIAKVKVFENSVQNELGANMVSRWKLDEIIGTTTTSDAWGSNTGTLGDGVTASTYPTLKEESECVTGKCMYFDGTNDDISIANNSTLNFITWNGSYTFSLWLYSDSLVGLTRPSVFGKFSSTLDRNVISCYAGAVRFGYYNGINWFGFSGPFTLHKWVYAVGTNNHGSVSLYLDGVIQTGTSTPYMGSIGMFIGSAGTGDAGEYWKGFIDNISIYDSVLSSSQIKQEYIAGLNSLLANNNISKEEYDQRINSLAQK